MLPQIAFEDLTAALDAATAELFDSAGVVGPPVDAVALARRLGFTLAWDDRQSSRARLVRLAGQVECGGLSILLKHDPRPERCQWAVAHEIGEYLSPRVFDAVSLDPCCAPLTAREKIANLLASRLLLPTDWFQADAIAGGWDLLDLKHRYNTASHELIARRMLDFPTPVIISIIDQERIEFRRSNAPGRVPPLGRLERECWRQVHTEGHPVGPMHAASESGDESVVAVRGWLIHEPQWRREILRLELADEW